MRSGKCVFAVGSYLITVRLYCVVYRFMPRAEVCLRDTLPGAFLGGLLWELAKYTFAWSLQYFHYDQIYGSVGAVVAVLTWSYVSSLILLFGAQLTAVFHSEHPSSSAQTSARHAQQSSSDYELIDLPRTNRSNTARTTRRFADARARS